MTHEITRGWQWAFRWLGVGFAIAALAYPVGHILVPDDISLGLAVLGGGLFGVFAVGSFWTGIGSSRYSVELSAEGMRGSGSDLPVAWSSVTGLRERPGLQRVDLISPGGATGIGLEYQLSDINDVLRTVLERASLVSPAYRNEYEHPTPMFLRLVIPLLALVALGLALVFVTDTWNGRILVLGSVLPILVRTNPLPGIHRVSFSGEGIRLRQGLGSFEIPAGEVDSVVMHVVNTGLGYHVLDVAVTDHEGAWASIRADGVDPFELYLSAGAWLRSTRP